MIKYKLLYEAMLAEHKMEGEKKFHFFLFTWVFVFGFCMTLEGRGEGENMICTHKLTMLTYFFSTFLYIRWKE